MKQFLEYPLHMYVKIIYLTTIVKEGPDAQASRAKKVAKIFTALYGKKGIRRQISAKGHKAPKKGGKKMGQDPPLL